MSAALYFGTAGWSYADWEGRVYPRPRPARFNPLFFLSRLFEFVEVNMTFYTIPPRSLVQGWVDKTRMCPDFSFWIKAHQSFTHERRAGNESTRRFQACLLPLRRSGRLAGLLFQFPYSFTFSSASFSYLQSLAGDFCEYPCAFEFRHRSWHHPDLLEYLGAVNGIWVNIDQPVISHSLPLTATRTHAEISYLRLHGRNYPSWFADRGRDERYNYDYSAGELQQLARTVLTLREKVQSLYISGNNHYKGNAVKNLLSLKELLKKI